MAGGHTEPLHIDVTDGTLLQLCGRKRITLFPPHCWKELSPFPVSAQAMRPSPGRQGHFTKTIPARPTLHCHPTRPLMLAYPRAPLGVFWLHTLACDQHAISMQSSCNQHAISMRSACNQHAISMRSACFQALGRSSHGTARSPRPRPPSPGVLTACRHLLISQSCFAGNVVGLLQGCGSVGPAGLDQLSWAGARMASPHPAGSQRGRGAVHSRLLCPRDQWLAACLPQSLGHTLTCRRPSAGDGPRALCKPILEDGPASRASTLAS